jgi:3-oxoacyl-[acyl-carrier-protein] synthase-3
VPDLAATIGAPGTPALVEPAEENGRPRTLRGAALASVGIAVPERVVTNAPIAARIGVEERWIVERTGVRERRIAAEGERVVDYAAAAGRDALLSADLDPVDLDLVLVATMSHERLSPNAAPVVASLVGAEGAGAIDVGAACTGFVSALALAAAQVEAGRADSALVVGADLLSKLTDPDDRSTAALFGDGAGAVVVTATDAPGRIGPVIQGADGARAELVTAERAEGVLRMQGPDTFRQANDHLSQATLAAVEAAGHELDEIDLFVYHQANARILAAVGGRLGLPPERVVECIGSYGNTSAASIPLALATARDDGRLTEGTRAVLAGFGGGLTWAATVVEWGMPR